MNRGTKNKIIMVNSFKGGTGKTSVALANCVHNCIQNDCYNNIFFIDIDRLGTSMSYALFADGVIPTYFDEYKECYYEKVCNKILENESKSTDLYAVLLNPVANRRQDYDIHGRLWQHSDISASIFLQDLLSFMRRCMSCEVSNLFVIDCSPGLTDMEKGLLKEFYSMRQDGKISEIEELYVTTFDASQIRKTVECLNDAEDFLKKENRNVNIVLNDLHNWETVSKDYNDHKFNWKKVAKNILDELNDQESVKIRYKKFEPDQVNASMIGYQKKLVDNVDAFVLSQEYREECFFMGII